MNEKDKEAFEEWWIAERGANDFPTGRAIVAKERQLYEWEKQAWLEACEYKQKEIDKLKDRIHHEIEMIDGAAKEHIEKLEAENSKLRKCVEKNIQGHQFARMVLREAGFHGAAHDMTDYIYLSYAYLKELGNL